mmetsp:Transcript_27167/g.85495  ORF Transcript_27167/g.85495 Transcript_27167/m.85495 type:complete len:257 (+) Transcript_27167:115-885(+)
MKVDADKKDRLNQTLKKENERLRMEAEFNDGDREYIAKQLLRERHANKHLMQAKRQEQADVDLRHQHLGRIPDVVLEEDEVNKQVDNIATGKLQVEPANSLKRAVHRLKRLLDQERRAVQEERRLYRGILAQSCQLQRFLRNALNDVHTAIEDQREALEEYDDDVHGIEEDKKALELSLAQEKLLLALFSKMFPIQARTMTYGITEAELRVEPAELAELLEELLKMDHSKLNAEENTKGRRRRMPSLRGGQRGTPS